MNILSYNDWKTIQENKFCSYCSGSREDDCEYCDNGCSNCEEGITECKWCNGTGMRGDKEMKQAYKQQLEEDRRMWKEYTGKDLVI